MKHSKDATKAYATVKFPMDEGPHGEVVFHVKLDTSAGRNVMLLHNVMSVPRLILW